MILALYITNCSEALLAAWGVRLLREAPLRFDTLRGMFVFLGAAVLAAPFVTSFPDATIVAWMRGEDFWTVWRNRFFANTLTELMLVPGIAMLFGNRAAAVRRVATGRVVEAALLVLTTVVRRTAVFAGAREGWTRRGIRRGRSPSCSRPSVGCGPIRAGGSELLAPDHGHHRAVGGHARFRADVGPAAGSRGGDVPDRHLGDRGAADVPGRDPERAPGRRARSAGPAAVRADGLRAVRRLRPAPQPRDGRGHRLVAGPPGGKAEAGSPADASPGPDRCAGVGALVGGAGGRADAGCRPRTSWPACPSSRRGSCSSRGAIPRRWTPMRRALLGGSAERGIRPHRPPHRRRPRAGGPRRRARRVPSTAASSTSSTTGSRCWPTCSPAPCPARRRRTRCGPARRPSPRSCRRCRRGWPSSTPGERSSPSTKAGGGGRRRVESRTARCWRAAATATS